MGSFRGAATLALLAVASVTPASAPSPAAARPVAVATPALIDDGFPPELAVQPADWYTATTYVPVLMYPCIRVNPNPRDRSGFALSVSPGMFHAQMD